MIGARNTSSLNFIFIFPACFRDQPTQSAIYLSSMMAYFSFVFNADWVYADQPMKVSNLKMAYVE